VKWLDTETPTIKELNQILFNEWREEKNKNKNLHTNLTLTDSKDSAAIIKTAHVLFASFVYKGLSFKLTVDIKVTSYDKFSIFLFKLK
jgi:hypothetical protein